MYLLKTELLIRLVRDTFERGFVDFEKNIIQQKSSELKIYSYHVNGHCALIDDVKSYYNESMKILQEQVRDDLFGVEGAKVYTKVKDSVPTRYRAHATVENSLIADGCDINGKVVNSILFRGVKVEEGAEITNSIIMENGRVMKNASLDYVITDKNVTVTEEKGISGTNSYPIVIVKNKTV